MVPSLPSPTEAAATLRHDGAMLERTREQARSAAFLASMMASAEQSRLLSRALDGVNEPESLHTQVYLIGRLYQHVADVYAARPHASAFKLQADGPPAHEVFEERSHFLYQVSQQLAPIRQPNA